MREIDFNSLLYEAGGGYDVYLPSKIDVLIILVAVLLLTLTFFGGVLVSKSMKMAKTLGEEFVVPFWHPGKINIIAGICFGVVLIVLAQRQIYVVIIVMSFLLFSFFVISVKYSIKFNKMDKSMSLDDNLSKIKTKDAMPKTEIIMGDKYEYKSQTGVGVVKAENSTVSQNITANDREEVSKIIQEIFRTRSEIKNKIDQEAFVKLDAAMQDIQEQLVTQKDQSKLKGALHTAKDILATTGDIASKWMPIFEKLQQSGLI